MLVTYFGELAPMIDREFDGEVQDFVGDQIFAIFNKRGDQPDHALRAARAALEPMQVKGKSQLVAAYVLHGVD
jgi:class 3 adenylate cyclase